VQEQPWIDCFGRKRAPCHISWCGLCVWRQRTRPSHIVLAEEASVGPVRSSLLWPRFGQFHSARPLLPFTHCAPSLAAILPSTVSFVLCYSHSTHFCTRLPRSVSPSEPHAAPNHSELSRLDRRGSTRSHYRSTTFPTRAFTALLPLRARHPHPPKCCNCRRRTPRHALL
jgi:hypothetical protein